MLFLLSWSSLHLSRSVRILLKKFFNFPSTTFIVMPSLLKNPANECIYCSRSQIAGSCSNQESATWYSAFVPLKGIVHLPYNKHTYIASIDRGVFISVT